MVASREGKSSRCNASVANWRNLPIFTVHDKTAALYPHPIPSGATPDPTRERLVSIGEWIVSLLATAQ